MRPETHKSAISPLLEFKYGETLSLKEFWGFVVAGLFFSSFFFLLPLAWNNRQELGITNWTSHHTRIPVPSGQMGRISSLQLPSICSGYREEDPASLFNPSEAPGKNLDPSENSSHELSERGVVYVSLCTVTCSPWKMSKSCGGSICWSLSAV